jgi:flagellar biosynthesis protein FliR
MSIDQLLQDVPVFVLVFFRLAGMMLFAPLFGSNRIPRRVRGLLVLILSLGIYGSVRHPLILPQTPWQLAAGIAGEMAFGVAMGMVLSFAFIAAQWAGEIVGQQMGLNLSESFDPQFGQSGTMIGDMYFMFMLVIFLVLRGHHAMLRGVRDSFQALPLLSLGVDRPLLDMLIGLFEACTTLALQLAAPVLVSTLVVDLALGFIGKTVPQLNVMSAGLTVRSLVGLVVIIVGLVLTSDVMRGALQDSMQLAWTSWRGGQ